MAAAASRSFQTVRPHIPLIKFRKQAVIAYGFQKAAVLKPTRRPVPENPLKDAEQVPPRKYARQPITSVEIDYVMRGGPE